MKFERLREKILAQQPALEQALTQLAGALRMDPGHPEQDISAFYHDFMSGFWDPYEETCTLPIEQRQKFSQEVQPIEEKILALIGEENRPILEAYSNTLNAHQGKELEHTFLVGYQCAFRFLQMAVIPIPKLMQGWEDEEL